MLLINICVLVGALLTPPSLWWLYSTHIAVVCLYQLIMRNCWGLMLIGISSFAVSYHDIWPSKSSLVAGATVSAVWYVKSRCYESLEDLSKDTVYVIYKSERFYAQPCIDVDPTEPQQIITLTLADRFGKWASQYAYAKNAGALLYLPRPNDAFSSDVLDSLSQFVTWRFSLSLVKGDRRYWTERDKWLINYLGLTHIFVVSGLHVGFVCFAAIWLARVGWCLAVKSRCDKFLSRRWLEFVIALPLCVTYTLWSGGGEPAIRATMMAFCFLSVRALMRSCRSYSVLMFCAWLMLLIWPGRALDASFWLSFSFVLLLVWLVHKVSLNGRWLYIQCLLSLFALLLTWGWQVAISSVTVLANLLVIPFVAFVWFPLSLISLIEFNLFNTNYIYSLLDSFLLYAYEYLKDILYAAPDVSLNQPIYQVQKLILVVVAYLGVLYLPTARGIIMLLGVLAVLIWEAPDNEAAQVAVVEHDKVFLSDSNNRYLKRGNLVVSGGGVNAKDILDDPSRVLRENWQVVVLEEGHASKQFLNALSVKTVEITQTERLVIYRIDEHYSVRSSACYRVLNLLQTIGCEHAESLESVLN